MLGQLSNFLQPVHKDHCLSVSHPCVVTTKTPNYVNGWRPLYPTTMAKYHVTCKDRLTDRGNITEHRPKLQRSTGGPTTFSI